MAVNPNDHDVFLLRQRIKLVINQYEFFLPGGAETPGVPESTGEKICFVEQKRFKFKEDIRFYTDESKTQEILRIKARQRFDPRATYDVTDEHGGKIGTIQKVFGQSLLRSTYRVNGPNDEELCICTEHSLGVALFRRLVGFIPYVENVADWLPIPYHFDFKRGDQVIGTNTRQMWKIRDVYTIDMTPDDPRTVDRRLVLAIAVGMDALQAR
ncbi:MAG: hypothetical protein QOG15_3231 [Solirubrobacteraceae bacterium]|jgi:uncharacterized protein YxjI|nr:hypothetical protein [Solirubrobacteraceae bacterium]